VQERTPHWLFLTILAGLGMVGPFSIDTIFPAYASMGVEWGVSALALQQLASVYLLSFAVMSLLHGPLSDALGRKPVILAGSVVYILSAIGCALAPDLGVLLALRAVQGLSAGAGAIVSRAMVRDVFSDVQAQRTMSHIAMIFGLAPALAPLVGGWILGVGHWRDVFWFLAVFGTVLLVLVAFWMPETHPAAARTPFRPARLAGSLLEVWRLPAGRRLSVTAMFNFGGQFLYVAAAPLFVVQLLGLGEQDFWVLFVPMIGGMIAGSWASGRLAGRFSGRRIASVGYAISRLGAGLNLVLALFTTGMPWAVLALPVLSFGIAMAFPVLTLAMLEEYPTLRGAASSVQSFVQLIANAAIAGLLAPALAFSRWSLALGSLVMVAMAQLLWQNHLRHTTHEPPATPDAAAYEPTEDM
jgi:DHA1 family bicyclomycin/chloramphenicol resistance-like MFS transporter